MSIILLRTLTHKSRLGFGRFGEYTVQDMINIGFTKELLDYYYNFRNIDFSKELKKELFISGEREIDKKSTKTEERFNPIYHSYKNECLKLYIDNMGVKERQRSLNNRGSMKKFQEKTKRFGNYSNSNHLANKSRNQFYNQGHKP